MAETLNTNMDILMNKETTLLSTEGMQKYQRKLKPLVKSIANLDNKNQPNATSGDVKGVLMFFVGADNEIDALIDEAMEVGAALFVTATQLTVARTLFRNPDKYAQFKREGTMKALKCMLEKECCSSASSASTSTSVTPSRRALLAELSSSDDSSSSEDNSIQVTKTVQSYVANISSNEEEPSEDYEVPFPPKLSPL